MKSLAWVFALSLALELIALPAQAGCNSWKRKAAAPDLGYTQLDCPDVEFDEISNCDAALTVAQSLYTEVKKSNPGLTVTFGKCKRTADSGYSDFSFTIEAKNTSALDGCGPLFTQLAKNASFVQNVCKKDSYNTGLFMKFVSKEVEAGEDQSILAPKKDGDTKKGN